MIDHITVLVTDRRAKNLYLAALAPLGGKVCMEFTREQIPDMEAPWFAGIGPQARPALAPVS